MEDSQLGWVILVMGLRDRARWLHLLSPPWSIVSAHSAGDLRGCPLSWPPGRPVPAGPALMPCDLPHGAPPASPLPWPQCTPSPSSPLTQGDNHHADSGAQASPPVLIYSQQCPGGCHCFLSSRSLLALHKDMEGFSRSQNKTDMLCGVVPFGPFCP